MECCRKSSMMLSGRCLDGLSYIARSDGTSLDPPHDQDKLDGASVGLLLGSVLALHAHACSLKMMQVDLSKPAAVVTSFSGTGSTATFKKSTASSKICLKGLRVWGMSLHSKRRSSEYRCWTPRSSARLTSSWATKHQIDFEKTSRGSRFLNVLSSSLNFSCTPVPLTGLA